MMPLMDTGAKMAVRLPDGFVVRLEVAATREELKRGLKHRDSLRPDEGMLLVFRKPNFGIYGAHPVTMWEVRFPLDVVWLNTAGGVVEVRESLPPNVPFQTYGGSVGSAFALEVPAGTVKRCGVQVGQTLQLGRLNG